MLRDMLPSSVQAQLSTDSSSPSSDFAHQWAKNLGVPIAYLYADSSSLAEVILAFSLLPENEQRRLAMELKARVSSPAAKACPKCRVSAARRSR